MTIKEKNKSDNKTKTRSFSKSKFIRKIILLCLLLVFWLLLSGMYDIFHISLGIVSLFLVMLLNNRVLSLDFYSHEKRETGFSFFRLAVYVPWLIWQMFVSSIQVAVIILSPRMPINPSLIRFKVNLPHMTSKVILGNSITLTPGTLTLDIEGDEFLGHALADSSFGIIENSRLSDMVGSLFVKDSKGTLETFEIIRRVEDL